MGIPEIDDEFSVNHPLIADFDAKISGKRLNWYCLYNRVLFGYLNFGLGVLFCFVSLFSDYPLIPKYSF